MTLDRTINNRGLNGDIVFKVNKGGTPTEVGRISGTNGGFVVKSGVAVLTNTNYTITDTDGYGTILVSTGAAQRTIALPAVATNAGRKLTIKKTDNGAGTILIDTPSTETIDGVATATLSTQYEKINLVCDGANWFKVGFGIVVPGTSSGLVSASGLPGVTTNSVAPTGYVGEYIESKSSSASIGTSVANITSISLTAGDWDVTGMMSSNLAAGIARMFLSVTTSTGASGTLGENYVVAAGETAGGAGLAVVPVYRINLSATTTVYLTGFTNISSTCGYRISARRVR